jgi:hypothetical protein
MFVSYKPFCTFFLASFFGNQKLCPFDCDAPGKIMEEISCFLFLNDVLSLEAIDRWNNNKRMRIMMKKSALTPYLSQYNSRETRLLVRTEMASSLTAYSLFITIQLSRNKIARTNRNGEQLTAYLAQ